MNRETDIAWAPFRERARSILADAWLALGTPEEMPVFEDDDNLLEVGAADSFMFLELVNALEEAYGVDIELTDPTTVSSLRGLYSAFPASVVRSTPGR